MTKYTPAPWHVGHEALSVESEKMKVCDIRGWGYLTGSGHMALGLPENEAIEIQKANAHLIASAPELLEALKIFVSLENHIKDGMVDHIDMGRKAIAKAEGRDE